jgi:hypothetical protein
MGLTAATATGTVLNPVAGLPLPVESTIGDPMLLPSRQPDVKDRSRKRDEDYSIYAVCGWCHQNTDMTGGIYDDGEWLCGGCGFPTRLTHLPIERCPASAHRCTEPEVCALGRAWIK